MGTITNPTGMGLRIVDAMCAMAVKDILCLATLE